jgi:6-phosphogluconolactonase
VNPGAPLHANCFDSPQALTHALVARLERFVSAPPHPRALMLSGGETPLPAYRALAARRPQASDGLVVLYSDDRYVPADSAGSNFYQTRVLLDALALPADRVLRVLTELPLEQAADDYDARLAELSKRGVRIELGLLGLGADGHTASLFNAQHLARADGHRALAVHRPDGRDAVSVTPTVLGEAQELLFVVAGSGKRAALAAFLRDSAQSTARQAVRAAPSVELWCDLEAWPPEVTPRPGPPP